MLWGNFKGHCIKATQGKWGHRVVHVFITILLFPPIVSQIASLFEMIIVRSILFRVRRHHKSIKITPGETDHKKQGEKTPSPGNTPVSSQVLPSAPPPDLPSTIGEDEAEEGEPPIILPNVTPAELSQKTGSGTPSPSGSDLSETPSSDSETPVSIALTASMQLAEAQRRRNETCHVL